MNIDNDELEQFDKRYLDLAQDFRKEMEDSGKSDHWKYLYETRTIPVILHFFIEWHRKEFAAQRQALRDGVMAAIGKNEKPKFEPADNYKVNTRNTLRKELRQAISTIFEGKGEDRN